MKKISKPTSIPEKPTFSNFQILYSEFSKYQKNLPHFRIDNATYFVTFRLGDSIPLHVVQKWTKKKSNWLIGFGINPELAQKNPDKYNKLYDSIPAAERDAFELTQQRQVHIELDKCHGCCILKSYHEQVASAIEFFHQERGWVGDYVVMPNHVHLLVQPFPGVILEEWLYTIKRFSSNKILGKISDKNSITKAGHLWQLESHDRIVRNRNELARIRRYIANNPAKLSPGTFSLKRMAWLDEFAVLKTKI